MCGTMSPKKPIAPVAETNTEVSNEAMMMIKDLTTFTFMPSMVALSSPKSNKSSDFEIPMAIMMAIQSVKNGKGKSSQVAPPKLPILQKSADFT